MFGNRVYLFGSHDKAGGDTYCMRNYEFWSAPVKDLETWSCKGVSYRADQDPLYGEKLKYMCLTWCRGMTAGSISTIVCPVKRAQAAMVDRSA